MPNDKENDNNKSDSLFVRYHDTLTEFAHAFIRMGTESSNDAGHKLQQHTIERLNREITEWQTRYNVLNDIKEQFINDRKKEIEQYQFEKKEHVETIHKLNDELKNAREHMKRLQTQAEQLNETLREDFQRQLKEQTDLYQTTQRQQQASQDKHDKQFEYILESAKTKAKTEEASKYIEKVSELSTKVAMITENKEQLEKEILSYKVQVEELRKEQQQEREQKQEREQRLLPSLQGAQGEEATRLQLQHAFGAWITVDDVSKQGQGKEMDLKLTTHYDDIVIRIDCKNYLYSSQLPEKEVLRFNADMDLLGEQKAIRADACILFTTHLCKGNVQYSQGKRGRLYRFHVGGWNFAALIEAIHESIFLVRQDRSLSNAKAVIPKTPGAKELNTMISGLLDGLQSQNTSLSSIGAQVHDCVGKSATRSRLLNASIQAAHTANPEVVTETMMRQFEQHLPKQSRGRPMGLNAKGKGKGKQAEEPKEKNQNKRKRESLNETKSTKGSKETKDRSENKNKKTKLQ